MSDPWHDPKNHPLSKRAAAPKAPVVTIELDDRGYYQVKRDSLVIFTTRDKEKAEMVARYRTEGPSTRPAQNHALARAIR